MTSFLLENSEDRAGSSVRLIFSDYEMTPPFKRRRRTVFTEKQLQGLEEAYGKSQYLDRESRLELCKKLSLSLHTVVYWFQNKRAISRRRGQPMENNGANSNSSSIENIHAYTSDNVKSFKTSPSFKRSPPHSPIQFVSGLKSKYLPNQRSSFKFSVNSHFKSFIA